MAATAATAPPVTARGTVLATAAAAGPAGPAAGPERRQRHQRRGQRCRLCANSGASGEGEVHGSHREPRQSWPAGSRGRRRRRRRQGYGRQEQRRRQRGRNGRQRSDRSTGQARQPERSTRRVLGKRAVAVRMGARERTCPHGSTHDMPFTASPTSRADRSGEAVCEREIREVGWCLRGSALPAAFSRLTRPGLRMGAPSARTSASMSAGAASGGPR